MVRGAARRQRLYCALDALSRFTLVGDHSLPALRRAGIAFLRSVLQGRLLSSGPGSREPSRGGNPTRSGRLGACLAASADRTSLSVQYAGARAQYRRARTARCQGDARAPDSLPARYIATQPRERTPRGRGTGVDRGVAGDRCDAFRLQAALSYWNRPIIRRPTDAADVAAALG